MSTVPEPPGAAITARPVTAADWADFEQLFGRNGAYGGCWCMWWRQTRKEFDQQKGEPNRAAMRAIIERDEVPGLLLYAGETPAAWVSIGPREVFPSLGRSRTLKPIDGQPVWSIVCFLVGKPYRGQGMMARLIEAAASYAAAQGARIVEAYPEDIDTSGPNLPAAFSGAYMGVVSAFAQAGFVEVERRSKRQPIMRRTLA